MSSRIIELRVENIKGIKCVFIEPNGSPLIQITGKNAQGKSSVLDSIAMVLGAPSEKCDRPVRDGEDSGTIVAKVDDLVVTRFYSSSGTGKLTITGADGKKFSSPQAILDKMRGTLGFDPLAFTRMEGKKQLETLRKLVGIDFTALDQKRSLAYSDRTNVKKNLEAAQAILGGMPQIDAPDEEVSASDLLQQIQDINNKATARKNAEMSLQREEMLIGQYTSEVMRLKTALAEAEIRLVNQRGIVNVSRERFALMPIADAEPLRAQLSTIEETNRNVRAKQKRMAQMQTVADLTEKSEKLTATIKSVDEEKIETLQKTKMPVDGLSFTDDGVLYRGVPFGQASTREQIRASVAIGLAMNPTLRVLLVREGGLLDSEGMKELAEFAKANDAQIWVERVTDGEPVGVVIEDGYVASTNPSVAEVDNGPSLFA